MFDPTIYSMQPLNASSNNNSNSVTDNNTDGDLQSQDTEKTSDISVAQVGLSQPVRIQYSTFYL